MDINTNLAVTSVKEEVLFKWDHKIKMLFNPVLWGSFLACFGIPAILLGIGFSFTGDLKVAVLFPAVLVAFFAVIWFIVGIVIDIGGGFSASFVITTRGIYFSSGPQAKKAADMAALIGALAGSAATAGVGMLARAEQDTSVEWGKIRKVKIRAAMHYIYVRGSFGNKPIGIYCMPDNFQKVLDMVRAKCPGAKVV